MCILLIRIRNIKQCKKTQVELSKKDIYKKYWVVIIERAEDPHLKKEYFSTSWWGIVAGKWSLAAIE